MTLNRFPAGLYVGATPIGHLADITERVRLALGQCDHLYAEDTRRTQTLLSALGISRPRGTIHALHEHNEAEVASDVLSLLAQEQSVLLVSDAGTPAISDPGFRVVDAAWHAGFPIVPLPGASALTAALSVCGFARWPICFWGFAPAKSSARKPWLKRLKEVGGLAVIYEAPHRATECLQDCADVFGQEVSMFFGRELTKQFETLIRGSITEVQQQIQHRLNEDAASAKGEMVWIFDFGDSASVTQTDSRLDAWAQTLAAEMPAANAAKCLAKMLGVPRDAAYAAVLTHKKNSPLSAADE
jgi:16S rRNA (cytidine1402-2'-O)-methyltransferase